MAATASDKMHSSNASTGQPSSSSTKSHSSNRKHKPKCDATKIQTADTISVPSTSTQHHMPNDDDADEPFDRKRMKSKRDNVEHTNEMRQRRMDIDDDTVITSARAGDNRMTGIELKEMDPMEQQKHDGQNIDANRHELAEGELKQQQCGCIQIPIEHAEFDDDKKMAHDVSSLKAPCFSFFTLIYCYYYNRFSSFCSFYFCFFVRSIVV